MNDLGNFLYIKEITSLSYVFCIVSPVPLFVFGFLKILTQCSMFSCSLMDNFFMVSGAQKYEIVPVQILLL